MAAKTVEKKPKAACRDSPLSVPPLQKECKERKEGDAGNEGKEGLEVPSLRPFPCLRLCPRSRCCLCVRFSCALCLADSKKDVRALANTKNNRTTSWFCTRDFPSTPARGQDDVNSKQTPSNQCQHQCQYQYQYEGLLTVALGSFGRLIPKDPQEGLLGSLCGGGGALPPLRLGFPRSFYVLLSWVHRHWVP